MKVKLSSTGKLTITAETEVESFALKHWDINKYPLQVVANDIKEEAE